MKLYLVDGTYELFRGFYGPPSKKAPDGREVGATLALVRSLLALIANAQVTHIGCAFDHVIESFRNELYAGYKTGAGVDPLLLSQFTLAEQMVEALGIVVWPMVDFEADDAIASAASIFEDDPQVEQIVVCSPDKDLAQLVRGSKTVCWDRRREIVYDEAGVIGKFGVSPESIPDFLALVGDSADGFPGITGWGEKSAAVVLSKFGHLEDISKDIIEWGIPVGRAARLRDNLEKSWEDALLFRRLATLRTDVPVDRQISSYAWQGATARFRDMCLELGIPELAQSVPLWSSD